MWKPRLLSLLLALLSFGVWYASLRLALPVSGAVTVSDALFVTALFVGAAGAFCGSSGFIASFMVHKTTTGYAVNIDHPLIRFLKKIKFTEFNESSGFCQYSLAVGSGLLIVPFVLAAISVLFLVMYLAPIMLLKVLGIAVLVVIGIATLALSIHKYPNLALLCVVAVVVLLLKYGRIEGVSLGLVVPPLTLLVSMVSVVGLIWYLHSWVTKTEFYKTLCPTVEPGLSCRTRG